MDEAECRLLQRAERNHSVFARWEARAEGVPDGRIDARIAAGRWERVQPSVLRVVGSPLTWHARAVAALRAVTDPDVNPRGRIAAVGYRSAAHLLGFGRWAREDPIEIVVTGTALPMLWGVRVHRTKTLSGCDIREVDGIPCTTGTRTGIDLATQTDRIEALAIVDELIGARLSHRRWMHRRALALAAGRRNTPYIARMTADGAGAEFRSWLERFGARVFAGSGLPPPRWNVPIRARGELLGVADTYFDPHPVIAELDGPKFHDPPEKAARDKARDRQLSIVGYLVLRFGYREIVKEPDKVVAEIFAALRSRGFTEGAPAAPLGQLRA